MKHLLTALLLTFATLTAHAQYKMKDIDAVVALHEKAHQIYKDGGSVTDYINKDGMAVIMMYHSVVRGVSSALVLQKCVPSKAIRELSPAEATLVTLAAIKEMHDKGKIPSEELVAEWIGYTISTEFACGKSNRSVM